MHTQSGLSAHVLLFSLKIEINWFIDVFKNKQNKTKNTCFWGHGEFDPNDCNHCSKRLVLLPLHMNTALTPLMACIVYFPLLQLCSESQVRAEGWSIGLALLQLVNPTHSISVSLLLLQSDNSQSMYSCFGCSQMIISLCLRFLSQSEICSDSVRARLTVTTTTTVTSTVFCRQQLVYI